MFIQFQVLIERMHHHVTERSFKTFQSFFLFNLMRESYQANPEPCTTMKVVVVPDIQYNEKLGDQDLRLVLFFPVEFTEIKQEKVHTD